MGRLERLTGRHWSWFPTILLGAGQVAWIALEFVYLPELSGLQVAAEACAGIAGNASDSSKLPDGETCQLLTVGSDRHN